MPRKERLKPLFTIAGTEKDNRDIKEAAGYVDEKHTVFARDAVLNRARRVLAVKRRDQAKAKGGEGCTSEKP